MPARVYSCTRWNSSTVDSWKAPTDCQALDHAKHEALSQDEFYAKFVRPFVERCLQGTSGSIITYGGWGSGKSYTLGTLDPQQLTLTDSDSNVAGVLPRCIQQLYDGLGAGAAIEMTCVEVQGDDVVDLLDSRYGAPISKPPASPAATGSPGPGTPTHSMTRSPIAAAASPRKPPAQNTVRSLPDAVLMLKRAVSNRQAFVTSTRHSSSRTHAVFQLRWRNPHAHPGAAGIAAEPTTPTASKLSSSGATPRSHSTPIRSSVQHTPPSTAASPRLEIGGGPVCTLTLVDTCSFCPLLPPKEGSTVKRSLLALSRVLSALQRRHALSLRESKLTRMLEGALEQVLVLACLGSSAGDDLTLQLLKMLHQGTPRESNLRRSPQFSESGRLSASWDADPRSSICSNPAKSPGDAPNTVTITPSPSPPVAHPPGSNSRVRNANRSGCDKSATTSLSRASKDGSMFRPLLLGPCPGGFHSPVSSPHPALGSRPPSTAGQPSPLSYGKAAAGRYSSVNVGDSSEAPCGGGGGQHGEQQDHYASPTAHRMTTSSRDLTKAFETASETGGHETISLRPKLSGSGAPTSLSALPKRSPRVGTNISAAASRLQPQRTGAARPAPELCVETCGGNIPSEPPPSVRICPPSPSGSVGGLAPVGSRRAGSRIPSPMRAVVDAESAPVRSSPREKPPSVTARAAPGPEVRRSQGFSVLAGKWAPPPPSPAARDARFPILPLISPRENDGSEAPRGPSITAAGTPTGAARNTPVSTPTGRAARSVTALTINTAAAAAKAQDTEQALSNAPASGTPSIQIPTSPAAGSLSARRRSGIPTGPSASSPQRSPSPAFNHTTTVVSTGTASPGVRNMPRASPRPVSPAVSTAAAAAPVVKLAAVRPTRLVSMRYGNANMSNDSAFTDGSVGGADSVHAIMARANNLLPPSRMQQQLEPAQADPAPAATAAAPNAATDPGAPASSAATKAPIRRSLSSGTRWPSPLLKARRDEWLADMRRSRSVHSRRRALAKVPVGEGADVPAERVHGFRCSTNRPTLSSQYKDLMVDFQAFKAAVRQPRRQRNTIHSTSPMAGQTSVPEDAVALPDPILHTVMSALPVLQTTQPSGGTLPMSPRLTISPRQPPAAMAASVSAASASGSEVIQACHSPACASTPRSPSATLCTRTGSTWAPTPTRQQSSAAEDGLLSLTAAAAAAAASPRTPPGAGTSTRSRPGVSRGTPGTPGVQASPRYRCSPDTTAVLDMSRLTAMAAASASVTGNSGCGSAAGASPNALGSAQVGGGVVEGGVLTTSSPAKPFIDATPGGENDPRASDELRRDLDGVDGTVDLIGIAANRGNILGPGNLTQLNQMLNSPTSARGNSRPASARGGNSRLTTPRTAPSRIMTPRGEAPALEGSEPAPVAESVTEVPVGDSPADAADEVVPAVGKTQSPPSGAPTHMSRKRSLAVMDEPTNTAEWEPDNTDSLTAPDELPAVSFFIHQFTESTEAPPTEPPLPPVGKSESPDHPESKTTSSVLPPSDSPLEIKAAKTLLAQPPASRSSPPPTALTANAAAAILTQPHALTRAAISADVASCRAPLPVAPKPTRQSGDLQPAWDKPSSYPDAAEPLASQGTALGFGVAATSRGAPLSPVCDRSSVESGVLRGSCTPFALEPNMAATETVATGTAASSALLVSCSDRSGGGTAGHTSSGGGSGDTSSGGQMSSGGGSADTSSRVLSPTDKVGIARTSSLASGASGRRQRQRTVSPEQGYGTGAGMKTIEPEPPSLAVHMLLAQLAHVRPNHSDLDEQSMVRVQLESSSDLGSESDGDVPRRRRVNRPDLMLTVAENPANELLADSPRRTNSPALPQPSPQPPSNRHVESAVQQRSPQAECQRYSAETHTMSKRDSSASAPAANTTVREQRVRSSSVGSGPRGRPEAGAVPRLHRSWTPDPTRPSPGPLPPRIDNIATCPGSSSKFPLPHANVATVATEPGTSVTGGGVRVVVSRAHVRSAPMVVAAAAAALERPEPAGPLGPSSTATARKPLDSLFLTARVQAKERMFDRLFLTSRAPVVDRRMMLGGMTPLSASIEGSAAMRNSGAGFNMTLSRASGSNVAATWRAAAAMSSSPSASLRTCFRSTVGSAAGLAPGSLSGAPPLSAPHAQMVSTQMPPPPPVLLVPAAAPLMPPMQTAAPAMAETAGAGTATMSTAAMPSQVMTSLVPEMAAGPAGVSAPDATATAMVVALGRPPLPATDKVLPNMTSPRRSREPPPLMPLPNAPLMKDSLSHGHMQRSASQTQSGQHVPAVLAHVTPPRGLRLWGSQRAPSASPPRSTSARLGSAATTMTPLTTAVAVARGLCAGGGDAGSPMGLDGAFSPRSMRLRFNRAMGLAGGSSKRAQSAGAMGPVRGVGEEPGPPAPVPAAYPPGFVSWASKLFSASKKGRNGGSGT